MSSADPIQRAGEVLLEAENLAQRSGSGRAADRILMHPELVSAVRGLLAYLDGFSTETRELVRLVVELLESITHVSQKSSPIPYWQELPPGTGTRFRKVLHQLRLHVKKMAEMGMPPGVDDQ